MKNSESQVPAFRNLGFRQSRAVRQLHAQHIVVVQRSISC